ncbi:hypothetical protein DMC25_04030 [Caulobacter sp. D4A]|nr:hypothetical protein DMC18_12135 [Caulobacter sp. D5]PXA93049.1 hypothetical protein DMC25_04030 [Caulobacter sp. D4A]
MAFADALRRPLDPGSTLRYGRDDDGRGSKENAPEREPRGVSVQPDRKISRGPAPPGAAGPRCW